MAEHTRPDESRRSGVPPALIVAALVWAAGSVAAFAALHFLLAAFLVIFGLTALVLGLLAHDWDQHSTFEERELARARKRKAKWEAQADTRERDRVRWEAHQARQARKNPS